MSTPAATREEIDAAIAANVAAAPPLPDDARRLIAAVLAPAAHRAHTQAARTA